MPEPDNDIIKAKKKAIDALQDHVGDMTKEAYRIALAAIENIFSFKAGKIVVDKTFIKQLNKLTTAVLDLAQSSPKFTGPVSQLVRRMPAISNAITEFQASTNDIKVPAYETAKNVAIDGIIDKILDNGLNTNFAQPLRDLIYQNATGGLSMNDARLQIKQMSSTVGKLGQYIEQTAIQAVDSYSGAINTKLLEQFDYNGLLMTGSLIDNSSPQCRYVIEELGGVISRKNWPKVKAIGEKFNGWIDGTEFDNLPTNKLHHGCRHNFYPKILTDKESKKPAPQPTEVPPTKSTPPIAPESKITTPSATSRATKPDMDYLMKHDDFGNVFRIKENVDLLKQKQKKSPDLSIEEVNAIDMYGSTTYRFLNRYLRDPEKYGPQKFEDNFKALLNQGLEKLPEYKSTVFRGVDLDKSVIDSYTSALNANKPVVENAFLSTSKDILGTMRDTNTTFIIKSKTGRDVEGVIGDAQEREVLFKTGSKFTVDDIKRKRMDGKTKTVITMTEL